MTTQKPLVSIIVPVYNGEQFIAQSVESVLAQSYQHFELIIINDGSTDGSAEVCRSFTDSRIRLLSQRNKGLPGARNAGIRASNGTLLGFLDADDSWHQDKILRHVNHFQQLPNLGLSYSNSRLMDDEGIDMGIVQNMGLNPTRFGDLFVRNVIGNGSNAFLRREVFSGRKSDPQRFPPIEPFDPRFLRAEDYELWARISATSCWEIACIAFPLVNYRIHNSGLSANTHLQRKYHLLAIAQIAASAPATAEKYRLSAVAHLYWHQARTLAQQKQSYEGLRAIKYALHYDRSSLNGNHFVIGCALLASTIMPKGFYFSALRRLGHVWGWTQQMREQWRAPDAKGPYQGSSTAIEHPPAVAPVQHFIREDAAPNMLFVCHKHRLMFVGISKNASTSLKHIMYREEFGESAEKPTLMIHRLWGWKAMPGRAIDLADETIPDRYSDYVKFAVYRDPVKRFLSAYHNRVLFADAYHPFYTGKKLEGMGLEQFINVAEAVLSIENPLHIDEHLRQQSDCYDPKDLDHIVPIDCLKQFLREKFGILTPPPLNRTVLPRILASPEQVAKITQLYARDYAIIPNWPSIPSQSSLCRNPK